MLAKLKRMMLRSPNALREYARTNRKVCMVVWNIFETDARVTKEAKSLIRAGKDVTVIAVHEPKRTKRFEEKDGIQIIRVDRTIRKRDNVISLKDNVPKKQENVAPTQAGSSMTKNKSLLKTKVRQMLRFVPKLMINLRFFFYAMKQKAGVYHSHDLNTFLLVYIISRLRGTLLVYDAHEVSTDRAGWKNKKLWEKIESFLIKRADVVITTNDTRASFFSEKYSIEMPHVIRNVPPYERIKASNRIREECSINEDEPIILYQGGIQRERGIENMIKCIPLVKRGTFVFIGNGALKPKILNMVEEMGLQSRTRFIPAVPNEELLTYTASADLGLQLLQNTCFNHYSACSNKLHEYIMAGIPVIASDLPEMRKVIESTETGLLVDPENIDMIVSAINRMLDDKELYLKCKQNTEKAAHDYKWELEEEKLTSIYQFN